MFWALNVAGILQVINVNVGLVSPARASCIIPVKLDAWQLRLTLFFFFFGGVGVGGGQTAPLFGLNGFVLLNRVWFLGS